MSNFEKQYGQDSYIIKLTFQFCTFVLGLTEVYIDVEDGFWGEQWWARMCPEDSSSNAGCCNTKSVTIENGEKFFWRGDNLGDCKDKDMQVNKLSVSKNIKLIESSSNSHIIIFRCKFRPTKVGPTS